MSINDLGLLPLEEAYDVRLFAMWHVHAHV